MFEVIQGRESHGFLTLRHALFSAIRKAAGHPDQAVVVREVGGAVLATFRVDDIAVRAIEIYARAVKALVPIGPTTTDPQDNSLCIQLDYDLSVSIPEGSWSPDLMRMAYIEQEIREKEEEILDLQLQVGYLRNQLEELVSA